MLFLRVMHARFAPSTGNTVPLTVRNEGDAIAVRTSTYSYMCETLKQIPQSQYRSLLSANRHGQVNTTLRVHARMVGTLYTNPTSQHSFFLPPAYEDMPMPGAYQPSACDGMLLDAQHSAFDLPSYWDASELFLGASEVAHHSE